ncbi:MAG TPA: hypothetical protein VKH82_06490 [Candidatus Binatia bacterium]|nr:hypothetical protein [Candidatus Binatia bacterium]
MRSGSTTGWGTVAAALPVLLAAAVYFPVTRSYFFADDFNCLLSIRNDDFLRFVLRPFAGHNLVVRNLVFYGSARFFGLRADLFFWQMLLTHLLNVWLLFRVLHALTASRLLASGGAALWGTSPVQLGTLGWYSVYGQVLVATALLVVLERVTRLAVTGDRPRAGAAAVWYVLLLAGSACFGTGLGVALAFPAVLFLLLPCVWQRRGLRAFFLTLPIATIGLYYLDRTIVPHFELLPRDEVIAGSISVQRVLTAPSSIPELVANGVDSGLRSFFVTFSQPPGLTRTVTLALFGAGLLLLLWRGDPATRRAVLAMGLLCIAIYGAIAIGRSIFLDPNALAITTRYHYVGTLPIVILACLVVGQLAHAGPLQMVPPVAFLGGAIALGIYGWARSDFHIDDHGASRAQLTAVVRALDAEVASHPVGTTVFVENGKPSARMLGPVMVTAVHLFPGRAAAFLLTHDTDELAGRRVPFVERDPAILKWYARFPETPLARLLVAPEQVPRP